MEILLLLYLSHLLGDFIFQTNWVYMQKIKSWRGGIYHALGILLALLILLSPFLVYKSFWILIFFIVVIHYIQDGGKLIFNKTFEREVAGYFVDQFLHMFFSTFFWFVLIKGKFFEPVFLGDIFLNLKLIFYLIGLMLITFFLETTIFVIDNANKKKKKTFKKNWQRIFSMALFYNLFFALLFYFFSS